MTSAQCRFRAGTDRRGVARCGCKSSLVGSWDLLRAEGGVDAATGGGRPAVPGALLGVPVSGCGRCWVAAVTEHAVLVVGGSPAGMMLAAELALAGVDAGIVERRADQALSSSRAGGFHSRTLEILDQRGIVDRFLAEGQVVQALTVASTGLDMSDFPTRHPYSLGIWQNRIEQLMAAWIAELEVRGPQPRSDRRRSR
jgi:hypothetical protein